MTILCATGAFHGRTLGMLAATDRPLFRTGFGPIPAGFDHVSFGNLNALRAALGPHVAAVMVESVQGEGGAKQVPDGYLAGVREAADEFGALMIAGYNTTTIIKVNATLVVTGNTCTNVIRT